MAKKTIQPKEKEMNIDLGHPNSEAQEGYFGARSRYINFGGARGGGKTWCTIRKVVGGAMKHAGITMLVVRRRYDDLENSVIMPILKLVEGKVASYNATNHFLSFYNGSTVKFGNMESYDAATGGKYQGQQYDWIFIEEATQFTEQEFRGLAACCRGTTPFPKRVYMTCNPGGIGHQWVKRLFVERDFLPEEKPEDYEFFRATVEDNVDLMESDPDYVNALNLLPEDIKAAHRYGDWDALAGGYFPEFTIRTHVVDDFEIDPRWTKYRAFDYGLDMFACLWVACDFDGRYYVYREFNEKGLIVSDAARTALLATPASERIEYTIAPPDMWSTMKDTGKTMAYKFMECGLPIVKANNSRVQGWLALKELLKPMKDGKPGLLVMRSCKSLIDNMMAIQHDDKNPSDCAKAPHELTHNCDALRYFSQLRTLAPEMAEEEEEEECFHRESYEAALCGGDAGEGYLG